jgi:hypothetical protein
VRGCRFRARCRELDAPCSRDQRRRIHVMLLRLLHFAPAQAMQRTQTTGRPGTSGHLPALDRMRGDIRRENWPPRFGIDSRPRTTRDLVPRPHRWRWSRTLICLRWLPVRLRRLLIRLRRPLICLRRLTVRLRRLLIRLRRPLIRLRRLTVRLRRLLIRLRRPLILVRGSIRLRRTIATARAVCRRALLSRTELRRRTNVARTKLRRLRSAWSELRRCASSTRTELRRVRCAWSELRRRASRARTECGLCRS